MPHFIVYALDKPDRLDRRNAVRDEHRNRLRNPDAAVKVAVAGPMHDAAGRMIGSMLVIEAESAAIVEAFVAGDPYVREDVYGEVAVRPFTWGIGNPNG
ncbi:MAG: YciI family protein [Rhizobiaceae bacterium]